MKYKLLLVGTNEAAINDFFKQMDQYFELLSSSLHFQDIKGHFKYYHPDALIYCLHQETRDNIVRLVTIKKENRNANIPYIILGDQFSCEDFNRIAVNIADLELVKPLTASMIAERIRNFLDKIQAEQNAKVLWDDERRNSQEAYTTASDLVKLAESAPKAQRENGKKRILIVDDDLQMLKVIKRHIEQDYAVATAVNGGIALRYLENRGADLILLDYEMPGMSGPEVLERIRKNKALEKIPVLFLTGASEREKIQKALSMKPQGYLLKPVQKEALIKRIREVIG